MQNHNNDITLPSMGIWRHAWGVVLVGCLLSFPLLAQSLLEMGTVMQAEQPLASGAVQAAGGTTEPQAAAMPADSSLANKSAPVRKVPQNFPELKPLHPIDSIFFSREEIRDIRKAVAAYQKRISGQMGADFDEEDILSQFALLRGMTSSPDKRFYTYPQFYLESLVFHKNDNWIIWVNGQKITQESLQIPAQEPQKELKVLEINENNVMLEWVPDNMDRVNEMWEISSSEDVELDNQRGTVTFTLHPNQTFSSYLMQVLEGKVEPVVVDLTMVDPRLAAHNKKDTEQDAIPAIPNPEATATDTQEDDKREGLGGLINAYQKIGKGETP